MLVLVTVTSAQAANWNSGKAKPVKMKTSIPISGLTGVGINSMALWSGASEVRTAEKLVSHLSAGNIWLFPCCLGRLCRLDH